MDDDEEWQRFRHEIRSEFTRQNTIPSHPVLTWTRMSPAFLHQQYAAAAEDDAESWDILEVENWNPALTNAPPRATDTAQPADAKRASEGVQRTIPFGRGSAESDNGDDELKETWVPWGLKNPRYGAGKRELVADWLATQTPTPLSQHRGLRARSPHSQHYAMARVNDVRPLRYARSLPEEELSGPCDIDIDDLGSCPDLLGTDHDDQLGIGGEGEPEEGLGPDRGFLLRERCEEKRRSSRKPVVEGEGKEGQE
jgi:hypothetical protein